ncbi:acetate/propionate family kinase [Asaia sp. BMEF1]|uniref:acetate/propionate family kinase n=1 Tax=Asaia sp. BMEF1 TaxID=3155932 RepID=UPI003F668175
MSHNKTILTLNSGSSSIKFALFNEASASERLLSGLVEYQSGGAVLTTRTPDGVSKRVVIESGRDEGNAHGQMIRHVLNFIESHENGAHVAAVGHRVLHSGPYFDGPTRIDKDVIDQLEALIPLGPLHQPPCIAPIKLLSVQKPDLLQVACFDTSFHRTIPAVRTRLPLPAELIEGGARVYGFHGLSYDFIASELEARFPSIAHKRVLVAHIGNGASLCALMNGRSIATTMGLTVLDGLMMGTRCGTIDPGAILYLLQQKNMSPKEVQDTLYYKSGLRGVSGVSSDMRILRENDADENVQLALDMFVERFVQQAGGLVAQMGGVDAIVFTGGIGQHDAAFRRAVCHRFKWLDVQLCEDANLAGGPTISQRSGRVTVLVMPADEETTIFRQTKKIMEGSYRS